MALGEVGHYSEEWDSLRRNGAVKGKYGQSWDEWGFQGSGTDQGEVGLTREKWDIGGRSGALEAGV